MADLINGEPDIHIEKYVTKKTITAISLKLTESNIISLLIRGGMLPEDAHLNARVYFDVPSGGDYSGERLNIDHETPLGVFYESASREAE